MEERRRYLLTAACAIAGMSLTELAQRLPVSRSTLYNWMRNGDPPMTDLSWAQVAARSRLDDGPLTAERMAAILNCPVAALDPASGWAPCWCQPGTSTQDLQPAYEAATASLADGVSAADAVVAEVRRHGEVPPVIEELRAWARKARALV